MKGPNVPENVDLKEVERVKSAVNIEDLVPWAYPKLEDQIKAVKPSLFRDLWKEYKLVPERRLWLLPSPFRAPDDRSRSVLVLPKNGLWRDKKYSIPEHIPPDVIGFVMAYDKCCYEDALMKLQRIAADLKATEVQVVTDEIKLEILEKISASLKN